MCLYAHTRFREFVRAHNIRGAAFSSHHIITKTLVETQRTREYGRGRDGWLLLYEMACVTVTYQVHLLVHLLDTACECAVFVCLEQPV